MNQKLFKKIYKNMIIIFNKITTTNKNKKL